MHFLPSTFRKVSILGHSKPSSSLSSTTIACKVRSLVQQGHYLEALKLYTQTPDKFTYPSLLKACAALSLPIHGKTLHASIITSGVQFDPFIVTSLVNMYVKCGSMSNARQVFDEVSQTESVILDVTLWNSVMDGYFKFGIFRDGFDQFRRMLGMCIRPDGYSLCIVLGACVELCGIFEGKQVHGYIVRSLFRCDAFLDSALIDMYMKCGRAMDAWRVFDKLEDKSNAVVRNVMIGGFCENGVWEKSVEFYVDTKKQNFTIESAMFSNVLIVCSHTSNLEFGMGVHCDVLKFGFEREAYVCTSLLTMYGRFMRVEDAKRVFDGTRDKGIALWNAMISAYIASDFFHEALEHYDVMRFSGLKSDSFTVTNILSGCSTILSYGFCRKVHGELIKRPIQSGTTVQSALLTFYARSGFTQEANLVFSGMKERDTVAWGSMVSGFFHNKKYKEGLSLFKDMRDEGVLLDTTIMASLTSASAALECVELGNLVHGFVIKNGMSSDVFVGCALIDMYAKCGLPDAAEIVFTGMPHKTLVAWNSIASCYSRSGLPELSVGILPKIVSHGLTPDLVCITNAIVAISSLTALLKGRVVHGYYIKHCILSDVQVENALIDMYIKSGCLKYAEHIFENMVQKSTVTWNSMIAGFGSHGHCQEALKLFNEMQAAGELPDDITFLALISACSHSGLISEGLRLFHSMKEDYRIEPRMEHYANMVDLWGRAGYVNEAYSFIQSMPIKPDRSVWLCLLFACRTHHNILLGELVAGQLMQMEPSRGSNYVQLLTLYGEGEMWDKAANMRVSMKHSGLKKNPGCSWIEMKDDIKVFLSGDSSSPRTLEIYRTLKCLRDNMEVDETDYLVGGGIGT